MLPAIPLLFACGASTIAAASDQDAEIRRLLLDADRVALVRVIEATRVPTRLESQPNDDRVSRTVEVVTLVVERHFTGRAEERRYIALATDSDRSAHGSRLSVGERALVFLHDDFWLHGRTDDEQRDALTAFTSERIWIPVWRGIWHADRTTGEVHAPPGALRDLDASDSMVSFQEFDLVALIEQVIQSALPCLQVDYATTGPAPWGITLSARGDYDGSDNGAIDPASAAEILGTVRAWREWPRDVGRSITPCESFLVFRLSERHGPTHVRVYRSLRERVTIEDRLRMDEALALWNRLPGARRPTWND